MGKLRQKKKKQTGQRNKAAAGINGSRQKDGDHMSVDEDESAGAVGSQHQLTGGAAAPETQHELGNGATKGAKIDLTQPPQPSAPGEKNSKNTPRGGSQESGEQTSQGYEDSSALQSGQEATEDEDEDEDSGSRSESGSQYTSSKCSYSGDEDNPKAYKKGGYHPVVLGQQYAGRYRILSKLGAGAFSTVWLCADERNQDALVAMKICKSKASVSEQAKDEIALLRCIAGDGTNLPQEELEGKKFCMPLRHHFWHTGPNGKHMCLIFDLLGENLLALVKYTNYKGIPMSWVRKISKQVLQACAHLAKVGVIHTDIKLENVCVHRHDLAHVHEEAYAVLHALKAAEKQYIEAELKRKQAQAGDVNKTPPLKLSKSQKKRMNAKKKKQFGEVVDLEKVGSGQMLRNIHEVAHPDVPEEERVKLPEPPVRQKLRFAEFSLNHLNCVLSDFGNGCWTDKHFTEEIQTRQYRAPEVLIGAEYDTSTDLWSSACMFFELLTGDFLFDPKSSQSWSTDEDQLALVIELLGGFPPKEWLKTGQYWSEFFTEEGDVMINISRMQYWPLERVLTEKYNIPEDDATLFADFLLGMLRWRPEDRVTAEQALEHPFLLKKEEEKEEEEDFMQQYEDETEDSEEEEEEDSEDSDEEEDSEEALEEASRQYRRREDYGASSQGEGDDRLFPGSRRTRSCPQATFLSAKHTEFLEDRRGNMNMSPDSIQKLLQSQELCYEPHPSRAAFAGADSQFESENEENEEMSGEQESSPGASGYAGRTGALQRYHELFLQQQKALVSTGRGGGSSSFSSCLAPPTPGGAGSSSSCGPEPDLPEGNEKVSKQTNTTVDTSRRRTGSTSPPSDEHTQRQSGQLPARGSSATRNAPAVGTGPTSSSCFPRGRPQEHQHEFLQDDMQHPGSLSTPDEDLPEGHMIASPPHAGATAPAASESDKAAAATSPCRPSGEEQLQHRITLSGSGILASTTTATGSPCCGTTQHDHRSNGSWSEQDHDEQDHAVDNILLEAHPRLSKKNLLQLATGAGGGVAVDKPVRLADNSPAHMRFAGGPRF